jgi:hypothetical protein
MLFGFALLVDGRNEEAAHRTAARTVDNTL